MLFYLQVCTIPFAILLCFLSRSVEAATSFIVSELGDIYHVALVRNRSPVKLGFPILRPRFFMLGIKKDGLGLDHNELMQMLEVKTSGCLILYRIFNRLSFLKFDVITWLGVCGTDCF